MISHRYRCIFIHIPKCAGTSIEAALGHLDGHKGRGGQDHRTIRMLEHPWLTPSILTSRENISEAVSRMRARVSRTRNPRNKNRVTLNQYQTYFKFTVVRNPWARIYSAYQNVLRDDIRRGRYGVSDDIALSDYIRRFGGRYLNRTQTSYIKNFRGEIPLDFIGRFERLRSDFAEACDQMGLQPVPELPHKVKGIGYSYRDRYDQEALELVSQIYSEEIELFGYRF